MPEGRWNNTGANPFRAGAGVPLSRTMGGDDPTPPETPMQKARRLEQENQLLQSLLLQANRAPSSSPAEPRPSLPVRAAQGSYRLTRLGLAVLGALVAIAELVADDNGPFRAIFSALFERGP